MSQTDAWQIETLATVAGEEPAGITIGTLAAVSSTRMGAVALMAISLCQDTNVREPVLHSFLTQSPEGPGQTLGVRLSHISHRIYTRLISKGGH